MKNLRASFAILLGIFIFISVHATSQIDNSGTDEEIIKGQALYHLISANSSDTSELLFDYQYFAPHESLSLFKDSTNQIIFEFVMLNTEYDSQPKLESLNHEFFIQQLEKFANDFREDELDDAPLWSFESSIEINNDHSSYLELGLGYWAFTGGAHGNHESVFFMIDKGDGHLLSLSDFISDEEELNVLAEPIFRSMFDLTPDESLNEYAFWFENDQFAVNNNFYFTDENMVFFYNPYEIAPSAGGAIQLEIPISKIKHLLLRED